MSDGPKMWAAVDFQNDTLRFHGVAPTQRSPVKMRNYYEVFSYDPDCVTFRGSSDFPKIKYGHEHLKKFGIKIVWLFPDGTEVEVIE